MKRLALLLLPLLAYATDITSTQTGNWNSTSTWVGGVVPGDGDNAIIANGHTVTIPGGVTVTVGTSPAADGSAYAIQCSTGTGTGILVVTGHLIHRGPILQCASTWTLSPGSHITHDSSQATTPSTANYKWRFTGASAQSTAFLYAVGTAGSRITVDIAASSGNFGGFAPYIDAGTDGNLIFKYIDISDCGTAAGSCIQIYPFNCSTTIVRGLTLDNFTITNSGAILVTNSLGSCTVELDTGVIKGSINTTGIGFKIGATGVTTALATNGRRRFWNLFIEDATIFFGSNTTVDVAMGFDFKNLYLRGGTASSVTPMTASGNITGSLDLAFMESRRQSSAGDGMVIPSGAITRLIATRNWQPNAHFVTPTARQTTLDGWIEWNSVNDATGGGDGFMVQSSSVNNYTIVVKNGVMLPAPDGTTFGLAISHNGSGGCTGANCPQITYDKNTFVTMNNPTAQLGASIEQNNSYAGVYDSVRDNIVHRPTNGVGQLVQWSTALSVVNGVFEAVDYNWTYNITTTQATKYYSKLGAFAEYVGANPGANDSNGDPLFLESTRTPLSYGQRWDSSMTTMDQLAAKYEACYRNLVDGTTSCDARFANLADMYNWVRAGWRSLNKATWTAAHDGTHVGGVEPMKTFGVLAQ